jgi:hypothetical protein
VTETDTGRRIAPRAPSDHLRLFLISLSSGSCFGSYGGLAFVTVKIKYCPSVEGKACLPRRVDLTYSKITGVGMVSSMLVQYRYVA